MIGFRYIKTLCGLGVIATTVCGVLSFEMKDGKADERNVARGIVDVTNTEPSEFVGVLRPTEAFSRSGTPLSEPSSFSGMTDMTNRESTRSQVENEVAVPATVFGEDQDDSEEDGPKTSLRFNEIPEEYFDNLKVRERMTTDYQGRLAISCISLEAVPNYVSVDGIKLQHQMARGEYDEVVQECQRIIAENSLWWESKPWIEGGEKNHWMLTEAQRLLANAYELKGELGKAKRAYEIVLGVSSKDYMWVQARCAYEALRNDNKGTPESSKIMCLNCFLMGELDRLMQERENILKLKELLKRDGRHGSMEEINQWNRDFYQLKWTWKRVWLFRDRVARMICPELYYVSSLTPREGVSLFSTLQKESFGQFLTSYRERMDAFPERRNSFMEQDLQNLELLHSISYDFSPNGRRYDDEVRNNFQDVPGERIEESGRIQPFIFVENCE